MKESKKPLSAIKMLRDNLIKAAVKILPSKASLSLMKRYYNRLISNFLEEKEPDLFLVRYLVHEKNCVLDIGANIGVYTKYLSRWVGDDGLVYSIEPVPSTFEILCSNIKVLQLNNARLLNCAISDSDGFVTMEIPIDERGIENHYEARIVGMPSNRDLRFVQVKSMTIDSVLNGSEHRIDFIKIDTEGHEFSCIKGAVKTIKKWEPALLIEISSDPDDTTSEGFQLLDFLKIYDYHPWWLNGKSIRMRQAGDKSCNYFFLKSKHIDSVRRYFELS